MIAVGPPHHPMNRVVLTLREPLAFRWDWNLAKQFLLAPSVGLQLCAKNRIVLPFLDGPTPKVPKAAQLARGFSDPLFARLIRTFCNP